VGAAGRSDVVIVFGFGLFFFLWNFVGYYGYGQGIIELCLVSDVLSVVLSLSA
jgi:hypothetical protein